MVDAITLQPFGPHHCFMCTGSVKQANTRSRGAGSRREMTNSLSAEASVLAAAALIVVSLAVSSFEFVSVQFACGGGVVTNILRQFLAPVPASFLSSWLLFFRRLRRPRAFLAGQLAQVIVEPIEPLFPEL